MKRPPLVTGVFVLVLVFLIGTGLVTPRDLLPDAAGPQAEQRYPADAHVALYQEYVTRMEEQPADCR